MVRVVGLPTCQVSPPFGEVTTKNCTWLIVNAALLMSVTAGVFTDETRIKHWLLVGILFGTCHEYEVPATELVITVHVVPPLAEYSILKLPVTLVCDQV